MGAPDRDGGAPFGGKNTAISRNRSSENTDHEGLLSLRAPPAAFRIKCPQMRHAHDSSHESRAWNLCSLDHTGSCEQHLCTSNNGKRETPWSRRTRL